MKNNHFRRNICLLKVYVVMNKSFEVRPLPIFFRKETADPRLHLPDKLFLGYAPGGGMPNTRTIPYKVTFWLYSGVRIGLNSSVGPKQRCILCLPVGSFCCNRSRNLHESGRLRRRKRVSLWLVVTRKTTKSDPKTCHHNCIGCGYCLVLFLFRISCFTY